MRCGKANQSALDRSKAYLVLGNVGLPVPKACADDCLSMKVESVYQNRPTHAWLILKRSRRAGPNSPPQQECIAS